MSSFDQQRLDCIERDLHQWVVERAKAGVPELVLCRVLRAYADRMEEEGFVSRTNGRDGAGRR